MLHYWRNTQIWNVKVNTDQTEKGECMCSESLLRTVKLQTASWKSQRASGPRGSIPAGHDWFSVKEREIGEPEGAPASRRPHSRFTLHHSFWRADAERYPDPANFSADRRHDTATTNSSTNPNSCRTVERKEKTCAPQPLMWSLEMKDSLWWWKYLNSGFENMSY